MFPDRKRTLKEIVTGKRKSQDREINLKEITGFFKDLKKEDIKEGINYIYSVKEDKVKKAGFGVSPEEMNEFINEHYSNNLKGNHQVFYIQKSDKNHHKIDIYEKEKKDYRLKIVFSD